MFDTLSPLPSYKNQLVDLHTKSTPLFKALQIRFKKVGPNFFAVVDVNVNRLNSKMGNKSSALSDFLSGKINVKL